MSNQLWSCVYIQTINLYIQSVLYFTFCIALTSIQIWHLSRELFYFYNQIKPGEPWATRALCLLRSRRDKLRRVRPKISPGLSPRIAVPSERPDRTDQTDGLAAPCRAASWLRNCQQVCLFSVFPFGADSKSPLARDRQEKKRDSV